ncbi:hypothetical protein [Nocardia sienata]|uniref:hypothetical protein n=1 Tax=Nocardia sienata TaxID=248552 RepID=UPI000AD2B6E1|nr:hypothetical protein [Nocardia sienata]
MAVRYSKREQTKLVNRVKKLLAQGKSLNAACTQVSEREGGLPATNTLANWVRAAGLPESADTTPVADTPAPPKPRRRTRGSGTATAKPVATTEAEEAQATADPAESIAEAVAAEPAEAAPETAGPAPEITAETTEPAPETTAEPTAELVRVRPAETAVDSAHELDDLLDENHRLRTALNEANREIRAMRDLLVVYASR